MSGFDDRGIMVEEETQTGIR